MSLYILDIIKVDFECNISIKGIHNNDKNKVKSQLPEEGVVCEVFVAVVEVVDPEDLHFKAASSTTGIAFLQGAKPSLMQAFFSLLLSLKLSLIVFLQSLTGLKSRTSMQAQYSLFVFSLMHVLKSSLNEVVVMLHVSFTETDGVHS